MGQRMGWVNIIDDAPLKDATRSTDFITGPREDIEMFK